MPELTDAQKVLRNDTGKRMADALEALAGTGGRGLPPGGTDGDVLIKNGAGDYDARWTPTPPQMGSLATIEPTSAVTQKTQYVQGEYLVYNGQLYKVTASTITQGQTLTPGGNISVPEGGGFNDVLRGIAFDGSDCPILNENVSFKTVGGIQYAAGYVLGRLCTFNCAIEATAELLPYRNIFRLPYQPLFEVNFVLVTGNAPTTPLYGYVNSAGYVRFRQSVPASDFIPFHTISFMIN